MTREEKAKNILNTIRYITIATVDGNGQPWNSPVSASLSCGNFYWASSKKNQHSKNIVDNGKAFIVVYDSTAPEGTGEGVYIKAEACEISDRNDIRQIAPNDIEEYSGRSHRRLYRATPLEAWLNDEGELDGKYMDIRVKIDLGAL
jgi:general stress protein 26